MTSNRTQIVDVTYDDPRTGERVRERRIQEVPHDELEEIRDRELESFDKTRYNPRGHDADWPSRDHQGYQSEGDGRIYSFRRTVQRGSAHDIALRRSRSYDRQVTRHRHNPHGEQEDPSDSDSSLERERRAGKRHQSQSRRSRFHDDDGDERSRYGSERRREGNILERNFDSSYDGIVAGVAGAAIGAMTARHFAGRENRNWKVLGGAVAGAAATNAAENWYRVRSEERRERKGRSDVRLE